MKKLRELTQKMSRCDMSRRVALVSGSRADYGLMKWVIHELANCDDINLDVYATGAHLSKQFGSTLSELRNDGCKNVNEVAILKDDFGEENMAKVYGVAAVEFSHIFSKCRPDLVVVLGDRYEIFAVTGVAILLSVPIFHIHGGEKTLGAIDDSLRHAISKLASIHLVATEQCASRLVQMGEPREKIFVVGAPGLDSLRRKPLLDRSEVETALGIILGKDFLIVCFHPETRTKNATRRLKNTLLALDKLDKDVEIIFTLPNADTGSESIRSLILEFCDRDERSHSFESMGHEVFLSCLRYSKAIIGNSSSAIIEAPSIKTGVINVGSRQEGRERSQAVIDCSGDSIDELFLAIKRVFSLDYRMQVEQSVNPYDRGFDSSDAIVEVIRTTSLENLITKEFIDIKGANV